MGSRRAPAPFVWAVGARAAAMGAVAFAALEVALRTELYATALLIALVGVLVALDLGRVVARADVTLAQILDSLAGDALERPVSPPAGFERFVNSIDRTLSGLGGRRVARQRQTDHLQSLADTVGAALLVLRAEGEVTLVNRAARRLAGREVSRLAEIEALGPAVERLLALPPSGRVVVETADGAPMLAIAAAFATPDGEASRLISLQSIPGDLDAVEQKAWRDLAQILSHEMMNSLTPIASLSESLQRRLARAGQDAEVVDAAETIARRSHGLMAFVDRYRAVTEIPEPELQRFPARAMIADIDRLMGAVAASRGVAYVSVVEPPDIAIVADRHLVEQALINLVKNAVEAAAGQPDAHVEVSVRLAEDAVIIEVADSGAGVPDAVRNDIFVPFFSTRASSGVGLSLARQIAIAHAGTLELRPAAPGRTTFALSIPRQA